MVSKNRGADSAIVTVKVAGNGDGDKCSALVYAALPSLYAALWNGAPTATLYLNIILQSTYLVSIPWPSTIYYLY